MNQIVPGRGSAGISTGGAENLKTNPSRPDISGGGNVGYKARNNGITILKRRAKTKTVIKNPKI